MKTKQRLRRLLALGVFALLLFPLAGCGGGGGSNGGGTGDDNATNGNWDQLVWDQDDWQ